MNETKDKQSHDAVATFAGITILLASLTIFFGVSALRGNTSAQSEENSEEIAAVIEATAEETEPVAIVEVTAEVTELVPVLEITSEATEIVSIVEATAEATEEANIVASTSYSPEQIARGQELFVTCTGCHGQDGRGIPGLGKDLVAGEFVLTSTDEELVTFIMTGRPIWDAANTTGIDMPARGGNPALSEADVTDIVAYMRSLQVASPEGTSSETDSSASTAYSPEQIALGQELFVSCSGCHGQDARGIPGLGKDLVAGEFVLISSDEELVSFIMTGRPIWDAANTTGIDMPARGGNPALTEADITAIVAYLRSLQNP